MALSGKKKIRNKNKNWGSADSGWHTVRPLSKAHFVIVLYFLHFSSVFSSLVIEWFSGKADTFNSPKQTVDKQLHTQFSWVFALKEP